MSPTLSLHTFLLICLCSFSFAISTSPNNDEQTTPPLITLPYITLQGAFSSTYNLAHYRRIPFGASTAGQNRFRAPQPPAVIHGIYDTDRDFDMCPQRTTNGSEDCLYLGVYSRPRPSSASASAPTQKIKKEEGLRPVLLTFYGGGFIQGSASFSMPPSGYPVLNATAKSDYVVVYANYRTNVFGFLPGVAMKQRQRKEKDVDLNAGLLDQQAALRWIQAHIHHFGGDKNDVTIWGQSAGGGSVVAQSIAQRNKGKGFFKKAMASSPFWPKTYHFNSAESEDVYERIVSRAGCKGVQDEMQCLKTVDVQVLRDVSREIASSHTYTMSSYTWGPVIEGDGGFLEEGLSDLAKRGDGQLNAESVFSTYNLHEGENFLPPGFASATGTGGFNSSTASFDVWLRGFLPGFGEKELDAVEVLYPERGVAEEISWNTTLERAGLLYRDLVLACPAYWLAKSARKGKGWMAEYTISPAKHASDTIYWNTISPVQRSDPLTYEAYTGAMASFVQTGDPNVHKLTNGSVPGIPRVEERRQFVVAKDGVRQGSVELLEKRCAFWLQNARGVPF